MGLGKLLTEACGPIEEERVRITAQYLAEPVMRAGLEPCLIDAGTVLGPAFFLMFKNKSIS